VSAEEYDDGFDSKASFERAGADTSETLRDPEASKGVRHFAFFLGNICTANADGSIPLNSRFVAQIVDDGTLDAELLAQLLAQANTIADCMSGK
jgi:hypothetical protein